MPIKGKTFYISLRPCVHNSYVCGKGNKHCMLAGMKRRGGKWGCFFVIVAWNTIFHWKGLHWDLKVMMILLILQATRPIVLMQQLQQYTEKLLVPEMDHFLIHMSIGDYMSTTPKGVFPSSFCYIQSSSQLQRLFWDMQLKERGTLEICKASTGEDCTNTTRLALWDAQLAATRLIREGAACLDCLPAPQTGFSLPGKGEWLLTV